VRERRSVRAEIAAAVATRKSGGGIGAAETRFGAQTEVLLAGGIPSGPAGQFQPGDPFGGRAPTEEQNTRIKNIMERLAKEIEPMRAYWKTLNAQKQRAIKQRQAAQDALAKLLRVPKRLQNAGRIKSLQEKIKFYTAQIKELDAAMWEVLGAVQRLEQGATEEVAAIAGEEQAAGGGGGGGGGAEGSSAPAPPINQLTPEFRLAQAQSQLTETLSDDLGLALQQQALFQGRLAGATNIEDRITLTNELGALERSISAIRGSTNLPASLRLAMAQAAGTTTASDDLPLVLQQQAILQARLAEAQLAQDIEAQISLTSALNSVAQQIENMNATLQDGTLNVKDTTLATFLGDILRLRQYQDNIFDPLRPLRHSQITVQNYYKSQPEDPVAWSSAVAFDLQALLAA